MEDPPIPDLAHSYDIIIAGGGIGGCGAAIQAARMGASVLVIEETDWIGGQTTAAGVTSQDCATPLPLRSGIYSEFIRRTNAVYGRMGKSPITAYFGRWPAFEPRVGMAVLREMIRQAGDSGMLDVVTGGAVTDVLKVDQRIVGIVLHVGGKAHPIDCHVVIDATEWGDLLPVAGARYRVGNCTNENKDESREIQGLNWTAVVRKYPTGAPSHLRIGTPPPGFCESDYDFQAFETVQIPPYDPANRRWNFGTFISYRAMPDSAFPGMDPPDKFCPADPRVPIAWRNRFVPNTVTRTHMNRGHAQAIHVRDVEDPHHRRETLRAAQAKTLGLLYYIQEVLGKDDWAVADDEGYDTPRRRSEVDAWVSDQPDMAPFRETLYRFPPMPYVRESRRIVGLHTLTAREIARHPHPPVRFEDVLVLGDYMVDLHQKVTSYVLEADLDAAGDIPEHNGARGYGPFGIPFQCFIPESMDGLLAAEKNISQSRLANGATRVQPCAMLTGQASGTIAALACRYGIQPRALPPVLAQWELLSSGCPLWIVPLRDVAVESPEWKAVQLVAARGYLQPDRGWCFPTAPIESEEFTRIADKLLVPVTPHSDIVTRRDLAGVLEKSAKHMQVTFHHALTEDAVNMPVCKSEAAQLIAELLVAGGLSRVTGREQIVCWKEERPVSPPPDHDFGIDFFPDSERWWMESHSDFRNWFSSSE